MLLWNSPLYSPTQAYGQGIICSSTRFESRHRPVLKTHVIVITLLFYCSTEYTLKQATMKPSDIETAFRLPFIITVTFYLTLLNVRNINTLSLSFYKLVYFVCILIKFVYCWIILLRTSDTNTCSCFTLQYLAKTF